MGSLVGALVLGAVVAQLRSTDAAFAHPLPPQGHRYPPAATRFRACNPANACYGPTPTTIPRRPTPTTTVAAIVTTTTAAPRRVCDYSDSWACDQVNEGIESGFLPDNFDPDAETQSEDLKRIIEAYGEHNPDFDTEAALLSLPEYGEADRGTMFNALAGGLGIPYDPDDPFEVADELADLSILYGHDGDGDGVTNPYSRPDADPDSTMTNAELAAFLSRVETPSDAGGGGRPPVQRPVPIRPGSSGGSPPGGSGSDDEMCATGLRLSNRERAGFAAQLHWTTLVGIDSGGEPGRPWPPHPDVPGGSTYLVVAGSPVWPVTDPGGVWYVVSDDGCLWQAISIQTRLTQLLPWRPSHRSTIESADAARPGAGFDTYLRRWDNLTAAQQAGAQRHHRNGDVSVSCGIVTAMISADSYDRCRWELPTPGVWSWQARACFEGVAEDATFHQCATLARGVEWFLEIIDYTSGTTMHHHAGAAAHAERRRPARGD